MVDEEARKRRGEALRAAVEARPGLSIKTLCALAGVTYPTWRAAIQGRAVPESYDKLEGGLVLWDANPVEVDPRVIVVELAGVMGVESVRITGHADAVGQITESIKGVLDGIRGGEVPTV